MESAPRTSPTWSLHSRRALGVGRSALERPAKSLARGVHRLGVDEETNLDGLRARDRHAPEGYGVARAVPLVPLDERGAARRANRDERCTRRRSKRECAAFDRTSRTAAVDGDDDARSACELLHEVRERFPAVMAAVTSDDAEAQQAAEQGEAIASRPASDHETVRPASLRAEKTTRNDGAEPCHRLTTAGAGRSGHAGVPDVIHCIVTATSFA